MSSLASPSLAVGVEVSFEELAPISREQLKAYADASGDFNPIHLDDSTARAAGLPGIIAHGMLTAAFLSERGLSFMRQQFPKQKWQIRQFQTRFRSMTFLGDVISVGGSVREVTESSVILDLQAKNQKGEVTTTGAAKFELQS